MRRRSPIPARFPRWNGTTENSRDAYFRAAEAGIECIETDIHLSRDGKLPMIHDRGVGRTTDAGEQAGRPAYNPFTGQGYNPKAVDLDYVGGIEKLHLRDEWGRTHRETVPMLPAMVESLRDAGANVVLQLDFKDRAAVAPAYWALRNLSNAAGVPANEWCIYKVQAAWWKTPAELEAEDWVRDALASGVRLAYIPVYQPADEGKWDMMSSLKAFARANYTISSEFEMKAATGPLAQLQEYVLHHGGGRGHVPYVGHLVSWDLSSPLFPSFLFFLQAPKALPGLDLSVLTRFHP